MADRIKIDKMYKARMVKAKLCITGCGQPLAVGHRKFCEAHRLDNILYMRDYQRKTNYRAKNAYVKRALAAGNCIKCNKSAQGSENKLFCVSCRERVNATKRALYYRRKNGI